MFVQMPTGSASMQGAACVGIVPLEGNLNFSVGGNFGALRAWGYPVAWSFGIPGGV